MKTAVSIPDEIFISADHVAKRLKMSRSELYTRAIKRYLAEIRHSGIREILDQIYSTDVEAVEPAVLEAQAASIPEEW